MAARCASGWAQNISAAVVGHVQPLVAVGRPRVGPLDALHEAAVAGGRPRPTARTRRPRAARRRLPRPGRDRPQRVERAGVHLAGLGADDAGPVERVERLLAARRPRMRPWSSAATGGSGWPPMPSSRSARSTVTWRRSPTITVIGGDPARPLARQVPARALQHRVARGRQRGHVRHLAAGGQGERGAGGSPSSSFSQRPATSSTTEADRRHHPEAARIGPRSQASQSAASAAGSAPPVTKPK